MTDMQKSVMKARKEEKITGKKNKASKLEALRSDAEISSIRYSAVF